ncbi:TadE/TadG family type IV pilus assembly protein [Sphingobium xenophagum]|uniref:TadE/TadG family type IV pilus assembly protein n=1 Tax=Sphingobium xenophagum TaxID=121428 RepID=UPI000381D8DB|nr:TadE/TadG family type IV pilus assembly protein [Sphingobium xenophagum]
MRRLFSWWRRCASDCRAIAVTEFALIAPFMILLYLGCFQLADAISASRKVTVTTRTLADLTSQYRSVTQVTTDSILHAASQVMAPYNAKAGVYTITHLSTNPSDKPRVDWSRRFDGSTVSEGYRRNEKIDLPDSVSEEGSSVLMAEITYEYQPVVASAMLGKITMTDTIYMLPRRSDSIPMN